MLTSTLQEKTAESFAFHMKKLGFNCDFSLHSLLNDIDLILNSSEVSFKNGCSAGLNNLAGIEAYIGETLKRLYHGEWHGSFVLHTPESNFYTSYLSFGEYKFYPARFLTYRLTHGENVEGTFATYLQRILPLIRREKTSRYSPPPSGSIRRKRDALFMAVFCVIFVVAIASLTYTARQQSTTNWQHIDGMKADLSILFMHSDKEHVYNRFVQISDKIPVFIRQSRKNSHYDPEFIATLSTWYASIETAKTFDNHIPRECTTWRTALELTWGEDDTLWDDDANDLWTLVTRFCEVSTSSVET